MSALSVVDAEVGHVHYWSAAWLCLILRRDGHDVASILYKYAFRDYRRVNYVEIDFNHV